GVSAETVIRAIHPHIGRAHVIGITGPPGAGKSTLVNELAKAFRKTERTVAIVAVDPTSPFTGGAILGDRVRMNDLYGDKGVFIRSMASRGNLGGLAIATNGVIKVFDASGFDIVLIETVGAGQAEVEIATMADTTLVVEAPGMGDDIQSIKAGILEIADVLVVNKADNPHAKNTVRALRNMLQLGRRTQQRSQFQSHHGKWLTAQENEELPPSPIFKWTPPIVETVATSGSGVDELVQAINKHQSHLRDSGEGVIRRQVNSRREVEQLLLTRLQQRWNQAVSAETKQSTFDAVAQRQLDPYSAAQQLLQQFPPFQ
ncbi:MAG: methylmalonyl Co-A mutase-associated GTPase MeaB, partial [Candidatus Promineifilaceae bacterium]